MTRAIVHLTTLHPRTDTRIRIKEIAALADWIERPLILVVADGLGPEIDGNVRVLDLGQLPGRRFFRIARGWWRSVVLLRTLRPSVVHLHDLELVPLGFAVRMMGIKVIYDIHEDFPKVAATREGVPNVVRSPLAAMVRLVESAAGIWFDGLVAATPSIARRFAGDSTSLVQNFPLVSELVAARPIPYLTRSPTFVFVGYMSRERGIEEIVRAFGDPLGPRAELVLAGAFSPSSLHDELSRLPGWARVRYCGPVDRTEMAGLLGSARAGFVLFHPLPNHVEAQPNKMFEYMSAGIPVIASDFPLWREIIDGAECGLLVDPTDPSSIAEAVQWVLEHPEEAERMGERGRRAVESQYNWDTQVPALRRSYDHVLGSVPTG